MWQVHNMKKNVFFICFYILSFVVYVVNSFYLLLNNVFVDISDVPEGKHKYSYTSPDGEILLRVYHVETGVGNAVRVTKTENNKTENIFWQTDVYSANVYWHNNDLVAINGILLSLSEEETFDSRNVSSIFNDGLMGWN